MSGFPGHPVLDKPSRFTPWPGPGASAAYDSVNAAVFAAMGAVGLQRETGRVLRAR